MWFFLTFLLLWVNLLTQLSLAATYNDSNTLLADLRMPGRYNTEIRPTWNQSEPTQIFISLGLLSVIEVNDVTQKFKASAFVSMWWEDELLQWNASAYGGVSDVRVSPSQVWKPTFFLVNTFDKLVPFDDSNSKVMAFSSGYVLWQTGNVLETNCALDVEQFPFDQQTCSFSLCNYGYTNADLNITAFADEDTPSAAEWDVSRSYFEDPFVQLGDTGYIMPCTNFLFTLKRKASVFVLNIILPVILMSLINNLVFIIPVDSGEKISFAVTVLLALTLFMTLVSNMLPRSSVPKITILLGILLAVSVLSVVLTILIVAVHHTKEQSQEGEKSDKHDRRCNKIVDQILYIPKLPSDTNMLSEKHISIKKRKLLPMPSDFKTLARIMDIICFVFFNCVVLIATAWYFITVAN